MNGPLTIKIHSAFFARPRLKFDKIPNETYWKNANRTAPTYYSSLSQRKAKILPHVDKKLPRKQLRSNLSETTTKCDSCFFKHMYIMSLF